MRAYNPLPQGYAAARVLDLSKNPRLLVLLNIAGLVLLVISGIIFLRAITFLRPETGIVLAQQMSFDSLTDILLPVLWVVALTALNLLLHEGVHGLFFWLFTRVKPVFAFRGVYAYAAAPQWYLTRGAFLITGLAPLVFLSIAGLILFLFVPQTWLLPIWLVLVLNASGAVGDLLVTGWLLTQPADSLINDRGDAVTIFHRRVEDPTNHQISD